MVTAIRNEQAHYFIQDLTIHKDDHSQRRRLDPVHGGAIIGSSMHRLSKPESNMLRIVIEVVALGALIVCMVRAQDRQPVGRGHGAAQWGWMVAAGAFELLSMMAFARTQRVVLRAAGVRASIPSMAATALAGNAISVSLPVIGPGAGSVFAYSRFRQVADDPAPAGWALLISGLISNLVWVLLIAIGATVSGNPAATFSGLLGGAGIVVRTIVGVIALRRPCSRRLIVHRGLDSSASRSDGGSSSRRP